MRVRVLGSAAGGGFPQWNCHCGTCEAARAGVRARPRTQSSLAIRGDEGPWFLVNASPDARQQLETLAPDHADGVRAPPVAGVLLTDAEIDHTAGLLLLRESGAPVRVFGGRGVEQRADATRIAAHARALLRGRVARRSSRGAPRPSTGRASSSSRSTWATTRPAASSSATARAAACSPTRPRSPRSTTAPWPASPRATSCSSTGRSGARTSSPCSASPTAAHTTWATSRSRAPAGRSRRSPAWSGPRKVLVHINNTNPILLEDSPEREAVVSAGVEVAYDGLEVQL